ncbi:GH36-type glycosyl hydrolase domain-containing protein [Bacillus sp. V33-4]|uniref:GH36-type glycosyl hydrolase domain-containing protein n=1 Tax=Bacillus sp. V33-4 TaxID=2054169 RepID=UPI000C77840C|nr:amylo-alpha-1,6-glucosidase [Bacillus sp. V33-4]PLR87820.1 cellobiose phosphorylase [Bacillus sp. V33-4]
MNNAKFQIKAGHYNFTFLTSGDLYEATHKNIMINQWLSNPIDGALNNLYLRLHQESGIKAYPLLGVQSDSNVRYSETQVIWEGFVSDIKYQVTFTLAEQGIWFWDVSVEGQDAEVDVIYGQDLGMAEKGAIRSNEAFVSQYIDYSIFEDHEKGYVVCSRQNQPQQGAFPYLQQGALTKTIGYSTDGFQFFGLSYKETNQPEVLTKDSLDNEVYQYEFAYTALQSERINLAGSARFVFYGLFHEDHPNAIISLEHESTILKVWEQVKSATTTTGQLAEKSTISAVFGAPIQTTSMTKEDINKYFPNRHQEEWDKSTLLSFFTGTHEHVVLKEKELLVERPHGHILMTGQNIDNKENVLTSTSYVYGIFNSQLVIGNTSFNKMLTNARNPLNVMKTSGQRIYVEVDGVYRLLTLPSMFEMGFNYARWFYKTETDLLIITSFTVVDSPELHLQVRSASGKSYRYLVTNQVSMNNNEYDALVRIEQDGNTISFSASAGSDSKETYPDLTYRLQVKGAQINLLDERMFAANLPPHSASLVVLDLTETSEWTMIVQGAVNGEDLPFVVREADTEIERYRLFYQSVMNGFHLEHKDGIEKMNDLAWWYTHNMLVHYSVPHGLEQYGGAAWGTRDVCQGPSEYFLATQKYEAVRDIIKTVYAHQYESDGNWPQWFMFDQYYKIQQEESHGDIIVWPLKLLGDYIAVTRDYSILEEKVPYTKRGSFEFSEETASILEHAKKEIDYIKAHFLHDTLLSSYGDGDWDDTLQPANAQLKKYLVSSWTVALTYQVLKQLAQLFEEVDKQDAAELKALSSGIEADFKRYILQSDVIPGFVFMEEPGKAEFMLHPTDSKTGVQYRLLPMTRSMIGELLTPEQAEAHYQVIKEKLYHADGVRLMDRPAKYNGGVSTHFKRAEQAANFGREIGLQYVHAHIRFVEAMAKLGKVDEVWKGLEKINPVGIQDVLPNAERRQSNAYFSSSDGKFKTRYEAQDRFDELRAGSVPVKGGWRIYSSGPGIYMNQLISNCLGIRLSAGDLHIDPVLPANLNGLKFHFKILDRPVTFVYHLGGNAICSIVINGRPVTADQVSNRYRQSGVRVSKQILDQQLSADSNLVEIYM